MKLQAIGIRDDKGFRIVNSKLFRDQCDNLKPGRYDLTIQPRKKSKSNLQLGYLFACVYPLSMELLIAAGWEDLNTIEKVDAFWKKQFAETEITNRHTGEVIKVPAFKRDFTSIDMTTYIDAIRNYCSEYLGGYIPGPEEQMIMEFNAETY